MKNNKIGLFNFGFLGGLALLSIALASVPKRGRITDDTVIYQNLREIRVAKERSPEFDSDLSRLTAAEGQYREKMPKLSQDARISSPMKRISGQKYKYTGSRRSMVRQ